MEEQTVKLNYLRMAPRKVRSVGDLIKGMPVTEAEAQLMVQRRRPAKALLKLLRSGVANAKNNKKWNPDHLFVVAVRVDGGPMLKRMLPRARGSASPIQKKMSNVTLTLGLNEALKPKYQIVVPKKVKTPPGVERPSREKRVKQPEGTQDSRPKKPGFFKRMFSSKSRTSK
ncbi:MAG TPA: 50S ribosomal protein L22 [Candidatus Paceibacterota bacterium]|jgi:large subunit ribosomal protein L22|nr:50S ribosomal protein L22 [Candidatus Paceibacterota bacterium]